MRIQAETERIGQERARVDRSLRDLRGRLEVLERTRKDAAQRNQVAQRANLAVTHEYTANLKVKYLMDVTSSHIWYFAVR